MAEVQPIPGDKQRHLFKKGGTTGDIIDAVMSADTVGTIYVQEFAQSIEGDTVPETIYNLWNWVTTNIEFIEDDGVQEIQLPGDVFNNRRVDSYDKNGLGGTGKGADCKSMSLFCSCVLRCLYSQFYDFNYRFTADKPNIPLHHVYLIVFYNDGYIPLDCTLPEFGAEVSFANHVDMAPTAPLELEEPHVGEFNLFKIGATTSAEFEQQFWQFSQDDMAKNINDYSSQLRDRCIQSMKDFWTGPLKQYEAIKIFKEHWDELLRCSSTGIYHYWNDSSRISYFVCQLTPVAHDIPLPSEYIPKRTSSDTLVDGFKKLGLSEENITDIINIAVWNTYGITMDYMLYRCYCLALYGQPFKPYPGVPYWDNQQGLFINNGSDLGDDFNIVLCFPAQGGVGRPYGQPYWSVGGNVMENGMASKVDVGQMDAWLAANPRPGTPIGGDTNNLVPGTIANNGAGISIEDQNHALVIYNRWAKGNMVMIPQPLGPDGKIVLTYTNPGKIVLTGPGIGYLPVAEIVSIVVAVVTCVVTITSMIAKLVMEFKHPNDASKIALPTQDFKWDYQTGDGCIIGHCAALGGCNGATTVKMCNGQITAVNPNPNDPANQPPDPGNFFGGGLGGNKNLLIGAAVAAAAGGALLLSE